MYSYPIQKGDEKTRTLGHTGTRWGGREDPSSRLHAPQAAAAPHRSKAEPRESHMARPPAHHTPHTARPKPVISAKPATYHALPSAQQFRALLKKDGTRAKKKIWDTNINIRTETAHTHVSQRSLAALPPPCSLHQSQVTVGGPLRWPAPAPLSGQKPDPRSPLSPLAPSSLSLFLQQALSPTHQSITHLLAAL